MSERPFFTNISHAKPADHIIAIDGSRSFFSVPFPLRNLNVAIASLAIKAKLHSRDHPPTIIMGPSPSRLCDPQLSSTESSSPLYQIAGYGKASTETMTSRRSKGDLIHEKYSNGDLKMGHVDPPGAAYISSHISLPHEDAAGYERFLDDYPGMSSCF